MDEEWIGTRRDSKPSLGRTHVRRSKVTPVYRSESTQGNAHRNKGTCMQTRYTIYGEFDSGTLHAHALPCNTNQRIGTLDSSAHHLAQHLRRHLTLCGPNYFSHFATDKSYRSRQYLASISPVKHLLGPYANFPDPSPKLPRNPAVVKIEYPGNSQK